MFTSVMLWTALAQAQPVPAEPMVLAPEPEVVSPDLMALALRHHRRAKFGEVVNAVGGSLGFVTMYAGSVVHFGCALDDACAPGEAETVTSTGALLTSLSMGVGGGLMFGDGLASTLYLQRAGKGSKTTRAATGLAFHAAAMGCITGAVVVAHDATGLWDAVTVLGFTTGGMLLWVTGTALGGKQLLVDARTLTGPKGKPKVQLAPVLDPLGLQVGLAGRW